MSGCRFIFSFYLCMLIAVQGFSQEQSINQTDAIGKRHGLWWMSRLPAMGEPGMTEMGHYEHGRKYGTWYKMDHAGDLIAIEVFRNGVLDGEAKYFEQGQLYCIGNYRGLNPEQRFDTIVVVDPDTHEESYKTISSEYGTVRHGFWRYYDPSTGHLTREEEYIADELIFRQDYAYTAKADSIRKKRHQEKLPHIRGNRYKGPDSHLSGYK